MGVDFITPRTESIKLSFSPEPEVDGKIIPYKNMGAIHFRFLFKIGECIMQPIFFPFEENKKRVLMLINKLTPIFDEDVLAISESVYEEFSISKDLLYMLLYSFLIHILITNKIIIKQKDKHDSRSSN